jgi:hypothetical protein
MIDTNYLAPLEALRARLEAKHPKPARKRGHPYTPEMSLLDHEAAVEEVIRECGGALAMADRQPHASPESFVETMRVHEFARLHTISYEEATACSSAAELLDLPLFLCDPRDRDIRLFRVFHRMTHRYEKMARQENPRRAALLEVIRRWYLRAANDQRRIVLFSGIVQWLVLQGEVVPKQPAHRVRDKEKRPARYNAKIVACEYVRLSRTGHISDKKFRKTVCNLFGISGDTLEDWLAECKDRRGTEAERTFNLKPDPLTCLQEAAAAYRVA